MSGLFKHNLFSDSNIKGLIKSLERKNGLSGSIDNDTINLGRLNTDIFIEQNTTVEGPITGISSLYISGVTNLRGATTVHSTLNVSGNTTLQGPITGLSSLYISGNTSLQGPLSCSSSLNVSGVTTITNTLNAYEIKQITQDGSYYPLIAPGSVMSFAGSVAPFGWFICDGSAKSRTDYATLFAVISTTYGSGNGSTTFNLPDIKGKVVVGYNSSETEFDALGKVGGAKTHTLSVLEIPSHNHGLYVYDAGSSKSNAGRNVSGLGENTTYTEFTGGNQPHNNLQPFITLNYIIKY